MNKKILVVAICAALTACKGEAGDKKEDAAAAANAPKAAETTTEATESTSDDKLKAAGLETEIQKGSYAIGVRYGEGFGRDLKEMDLTAFYKGIEDGFAGKEPLMTQEQMMATLQALQERKIKEQEEANEKALKENKEAGAKFLAENKMRDGVVETKSGLQYEVMKEGKGASPGAEDEVKVHYHGTLPDGTVFDSSVDRGEPVTFMLNAVIKGWTEGLQLMKEGGKAKLYVPYDLAYGERAVGSHIGPNQTLVFEVELLEIIKKEDKEADDKQAAAESEEATKEN